MGASYAVGLPNVGEFGDVRTLLELGLAAEEHGWDGVHLWDHLLYREPGWPVAPSTVAAAAIAAATRRVRIILTVALARRQVQDVALDTAGIASLSNGRLTVLAVIGSMDREYAEFGLDPDPAVRGAALDERLERLRSLWDGWGVAPIPIWCGGRWPGRAGLRRAARFDGVLPTFAEQRSRNVPSGEFAAAAAFVRRSASRTVDIALEGSTEDAGAASELGRYVAAGLTWWVEALGWWRGDRTAAAARIAAGPPRFSSK